MLSKFVRYSALILSLCFSTFAYSEALFNKTQGNVAIEGYDTVTYFTQNQAIKGSAEYQSTYADVIWYFSSEETKALFDAEPIKYVPQFSGHCANGLSDGHLVRANPEIFRIIDDRLYLFFSWWGKAQWKFNQQEQIGLATRYWDFTVDTFLDTFGN